MADMFYFCSPPAPVKYFGSSAKRYRRPHRRNPHSRTKMEHARMARFVEPVFCSTTFPFFLQPDDSISQESSQTAHQGRQDDAQDMAYRDMDVHDHGPEDVMEETSSRTPIEGDSLLLAQHDSTFLEEDERRPRVAPAVSEIVPPFETKTDPLARSRHVSHQPSCDSLRASSIATDGRHSQMSLDGSHILTSTGYDLLPEEVRLHSSIAAQYTVLTDMAETAWSVDDPRYGADVLDSVSSWTSWDPSAGHIELTDRLIERAGAELSTRPTFNRQELKESAFDMQGITWDSLYVSRQRCLRDRAILYLQPNPDRMSLDDGFDSQCHMERYYCFHYFNGSKKPRYTHHQLRHVLGSIGRDVYYTNGSKVMQSSLAFPGSEDTVLDLTRSARTDTPIRVTCLAAATDPAIVVAGGFDGEYALRNLDSSEPHSEGYITRDRNGLVTHIHTFAHRRSGLPQAAFCANDQRLRIMDLATEAFTKTLPYDYSLNCAVTSSDGRLRALAGDSADALITDAESGDTLAALQSHTAHIFSCAWSPDDRLLATGAQDGKIALWDARNWAQPLAELPNVSSCSRSLHFTADGSKLISAENEDVVSIFDTRLLAEQRQDIRFFGTISGVTLVDGGDEIVIANGDRSVGGLMSFRRTWSDFGDVVHLEGTMEPVERCRRKAARRRNAGRASDVEDLIV